VFRNSWSVFEGYVGPVGGVVEWVVWSALGVGYPSGLAPPPLRSILGRLAGSIVCVCGGLTRFALGAGACWGCFRGYFLDSE
jgi:hypothetical protein